MVIKLLTFIFNQAIGNLPEGKKKELRERFDSLLKEVVTAVAKGAVEGLKK